MKNLMSNRFFRILTKTLIKLILIIIIFFLVVVLRLYVLKHSNPQNPNFTRGNLEMYMLDIGQGDAFVFLQNDKVLLVDTGNIYDWNATNKALKELGVKKIDYLIITHPHQDHIGGLFSVCMNYKIDELITQNINPQDVPGREFTFHIYNFAIKLANFAYGDSLVTLARENKIYRDFSFADSKVEFLGPEDETYEIFNNYSLVFRIEYGNISILMTGDMEYEVEEQLLESGKDLSSTIYKAAHHGSNTSNEEAFMEKVNPEYVLISSDNGNHNYFGHPVRRFMKYLESREIPIYRTDEQGTVKLTIDGTNVEVDLPQADYKSGTEFLKEKEEG